MLTDLSAPILVFVFGLVAGSFLNVVIVRYRELQTVVNSRSHCPSCRRQIAWYDLFPLISFVLLRARCRYCHERISWRYPLVELTIALVALHLYVAYGLNWQAALYFLIFALLVAISFIDLNDRVVPDELMLSALLLSFLLVVTVPGYLERLPMWGALIAGGLLATFVLVSRGRWMGSGDIGLAIILGLLGGLSGAVVGLVVAFFGGTLIGLLSIGLGRLKMKDSIPFGPYLAVGSYVAALYGPAIASWYLDYINYY